MSVGWTGLFVALALVSVSGARADELRPFSTEGCTAWREGPRRQPNLWRHCCVAHDLEFWAGGVADGRNQADLNLRDCVAATGAGREARIIYLGVRIGSLSPRKIHGMQWGNAWSRTVTRSTPLTESEIDRLEHELRDARYDSVLTIESRLRFIANLRLGRNDP